MLKAIFTIALVGILVPAMVAQAAFSDDFESGYSAAALGGQNGWNASSNYVVGSSSGVGSSWGLTAGANVSEGYKLHGETLNIGDTIIVDADAWATSLSNISIREFGDYDPRINLMFGTNMGGNDGSSFRLADSLSGNPYIEDNAFFDIVPGTWLHAQITWTVGGSAVGKVWDDGGNLLVTHTIANSGTYIASPSLMTAVQIYSVSTTAKFDNVVVTPEPATLAVLGLGGLLSLLRRRR